jgi:hypothetical protein
MSVLFLNLGRSCGDGTWPLVKSATRTPQLFCPASTWVLCRGPSRDLTPAYAMHQRPLRCRSMKASCLDVTRIYSTRAVRARRCL